MYKVERLLISFPQLYTRLRSSGGLNVLYLTTFSLILQPLQDELCGHVGYQSKVYVNGCDAIKAFTQFH